MRALLKFATIVTQNRPLLTAPLAYNADANKDRRLLEPPFSGAVVKSWCTQLHTPTGCKSRYRSCKVFKLLWTAQCRPGALKLNILGYQSFLNKQRRMLQRYGIKFRKLCIINIWTKLWKSHLMQNNFVVFEHQNMNS